MEANMVFANRKISAQKKFTTRLVRKRAEEIYLKRILEGTSGDAISDWLQAEQELMN